MERLHKNKKILDKYIGFLEEKGWEGRKTKATWGWMKRIPLRTLRIDLTNVEMIGST